MLPEEIDVVEGHGTGTRLGDPIEVQALRAVYRGRPPERPLWLGSVKSNIGHTQAAAGVAGVIKMVMALEHGVLPRTLHAERPSEQVDWSADAPVLLREERAWAPGDELRRAAVSSFGISGTNVHMILEEAPRVDVERAVRADAGESAPIPWVLSARSPQALADQVGRLREHLLGHPQLSAPDVSLSLAAGRTALEHRAVLLGERKSVLLEKLAALAREGTSTGAIVGRASARRPLLAFLFTGQGSQRPGMGRELYGSYPVFAQAFDEVCAYLDEALGSPIADLVIRGEGERDAETLGQTVFAQAGLFALEVALFRLMEQHELRPDFLLGHSIGELAAAHVAGVFGLRDACELVAARGRLMQALPGGGAMVSVEAGEEEVAEELLHAL